MTGEPVNIYEYEALAHERLPKPEYDFIAGGATDEITLKRTRAVFDAIMLRPRMLVDISQPNLSTTVLGHQVAFPILLDPAGNHGRAHQEGELATARAAGAMGTVMLLSSGSSYTLEEVAKAATGPIWFQQYLYRDRGLSKMMAQRAQDAGYSALCLTLDSTVRAKRERNIRNNYSNAPSPNYAGLEVEEGSWNTSSDAPRGTNRLIDRSATWPYLDWLAANTPLPLVVKGIMTGEDGRLCAEHGVKGVIVSNHGARQLDTTFASVEVLPGWWHTAWHRRAQSAGAGGQSCPHRASAVLGAGRGWRTGSPGGPADAPGRVGDGHGHVWAPHDSEHRHQPAGDHVTPPVRAAPTPGPAVPSIVEQPGARQTRTTGVSPRARRSMPDPGGRYQEAEQVGDALRAPDWVAQGR
jgi:isopentenyl diphosphate isomerase/L-lactate dehydrogenase-like FMN-dependent dehydrogenase